MFAEWALALKNVFLPEFCKACGRQLLTEENHFFCPTCWEMSPRVERPFCTICGRPHRGAIGFGTQSNFLCAECREPKPRPFRRIFGATVYDGTVAEAIKLLKFAQRRRAALPLARTMAQFAEQEIDCGSYDALVPVPLHRVRERTRGFNQSRLLAIELLPLFPRAVLDDSLKRIRPTRVQSLAVSPEERRANVVGAFTVEGDNLKGKTVLLIDDVITTGGTSFECATALLRAGAKAVDIFAAALAVQSGTYRG